MSNLPSSFPSIKKNKIKSAITRRWNLKYAISMTLMQTSGITDAVNPVTKVEHMIKPPTALGVKLSCFLQKEREREGMDKSRRCLPHDESVRGTRNI